METKSKTNPASTTVNHKHAIQRWCPPLPIFRRLGFRTATEIEIERYALKMLRGDLDAVKRDSNLETSVTILQRPSERH